MPMMEIERKLSANHQNIAEIFNTYYISVADNIINSNQANNITDDLQKKDPLNYLHSTFQRPATNTKLKNATTGEIGKIIKQLKNKISCGYDEVTTKI